MKLKVLLAAFLLLVSATSVFAAGPYLGASGGLTFVHEGDIEVSGLGSVSAEYDAGYGVNVAAGYDFDAVRFELEFGYKNADLDTLSGPGGSVDVSDAEIKVMSYMANVLVDFKSNSPLTPYIGGGVGLVNGEFEIEGEDDDDDEFGYQLIAGLAFNATPNLALDLSYRFQSAPSDFSREGVSIEYNSSNVMAGVRFKF